MRISVDGSRIRNNIVAFSNLSGIVRTGPETRLISLSTMFGHWVRNNFSSLEISSESDRWKISEVSVRHKPQSHPLQHARRNNNSC